MLCSAKQKLCLHGDRCHKMDCFYVHPIQTGPRAPSSVATGGFVVVDGRGQGGGGHIPEKSPVRMPRVAPAAKPDDQDSAKALHKLSAHFQAVFLRHRMAHQRLIHKQCGGQDGDGADISETDTCMSESGYDDGSSADGQSKDDEDADAESGVEYSPQLQELHRQFKQFDMAMGAIRDRFVFVFVFLLGFTTRSSSRK